MKAVIRTIGLAILSAAVAACAGCAHMPGYAKAGEEAASRPSRILDFQTLYQQNCSGCHGSNGRDGAAIALNNPAYLAIAGAGTIRAAAAKGVSGTLMPAFARSAGGMLTDEQIDALVQGMLHTWARPSDFAGGNLPPYASDAPGNAMNGQRVYAAACARCHGADGSGAARSAQSDASALSIVDSSYLALVSDQSLRSIVLAGHPEKSTPDWRSYIGGPGGRALTAAEVNDVVAWIAGHRASANEQAASPNAKAGKETK